MAGAKRLVKYATKEVRTELLKKRNKVLDPAVAGRKEFASVVEKFCKELKQTRKTLYAFKERKTKMSQWDDVKDDLMTVWRGWPPFLTIKETANFLKVPEATVEKLLKGSLSGAKCERDGTFLLERNKLIEWFAEHVEFELDRNDEILRLEGAKLKYVKDKLGI